MYVFKWWTTEIVLCAVVRETWLVQPEAAKVDNDMYLLKEGFKKLDFPGKSKLPLYV